MCALIERHPGKFESESCITKVAYDWLIDGMADEYGSTEEGTPDIFYGPFTDATSDNPICDECLAEILSAKEIRLWESNDGFVTTEVIE